MLLLAALLVLASCAGGADTPGDSDRSDGGPPSSVVTTTGGKVRGVLGEGAGGNVETFYGIPYAAPPVGDLRWRPPQPPEPWTGVRDGGRRGRPCPQEGVLAVGSSEDCLFVNLSRPAGEAGRAGRKLPVLVWIHGGAFVAGSANSFDLSALAANGPALVVAVNYRLGALGYLATPELNEESGGQAGSYAVADLVAALKWVRDNAAAFGGDPGNVTVFGESAGSLNICSLIAAPPARGLFHRAILQSGPCAWPLPTMQEAERNGTEFARALGCLGQDPAARPPADEVLRCLRGKSIQEIMEAGGGAQPAILDALLWAPAVGGRTQPLPALEAVDAGTAADVPILIGTVRDEGRGFTTVWTGTQPVTDAMVDEIVRSKVPERADAVLAAYPAGSAQPRERLARIITDYVFTCPTIRSAYVFSAVGDMPVYLYEFDIPGFGPVADGVATGATHGTEVGYLFPIDSPDAPSTPQERELSSAMIDYWFRFAATGDPNKVPDGLGDTERLPTWPRWDAVRADRGEPDRLALEPGAIEQRAGLFGDHHCDVWW